MLPLMIILNNLYIALVYGKEFLWLSLWVTRDLMMSDMSAKVPAALPLGIRVMMLQKV